MRHAPYLAAAELDRRLGDPTDEGRLFSYARCGALDDREEFPLEICRELDLLGLHRQYVPYLHGGELRSYEQVLQLMRAVARRDLTVAVAHGKTFLGAVSVWVGGDARQIRETAARVADGAVVSWGLTERDHGSDLLAGEVTARRDGGHYRLDGEKWLINNANRGQLICVLARTKDTEGPRGFSLLMVDKQRLDRSAYRPLPQVRLHGIRGADISGIAFTDTKIPEAALVGAEGEGSEIVLKSLQLTRTLCAALSLGAADHALTLATGYALDRHAYGDRLANLPQTRRLLAQSYADVLLAEATTLVAGRSLHTLTGELATVSAVTKYFVPTLVDRVVARLSTVLGARSLLVGDTYEHGRFQKLQRDHRIVGIFDGNTVVNLHALINLFPLLARQWRRGTVDERGLGAATTLAAELPDFDRDSLSLLPRTGCSVVQALAPGVEELSALAARGELPASVARRAEGVLAAAEGLATELDGYRPTAVDVPASAFTLAERYAWCFAASAAVHLWLRNRQAVAEAGADAGYTAELWQDGRWLEAVLARVLDHLGTSWPDAGDDVLERLVPTLIAQHESGQLPSLLHHPLKVSA
ncbi:MULTISPECIES: acyl-CoA dehydrogenase [Streptomyces]|uniref:acyl-CoA dehydrogenase n=1 Tax=Streptomyces TaxID=1883 RepID=UPI001E31F19C|nr:MULTISPECIES: acyl-CoA dehydrogenase [Streptomyces]UFQ18550.1 acyl-CoA dehydrogenase [Streptomyces huasconensis]WCL88164.1 acyl-CoA dehydrogenase [Streptomyces sp. JCM 35825]